jgi:hypothetical protein
MPRTKRALVAGMMAAALLVAPMGFGSAVPSAAAAQVDPNPGGKSMGQLLDEGYTCTPIGGGVVQCYRDKNSPKYECRTGGCYPAATQHDQGGVVQRTPGGGVLTQQP